MLITLLSCMALNFSSLDFICCVYTIKYYKTAFQARLINVKDEMFIWEWDKENVRVPFSDKDLSGIQNAMSEEIWNSKGKTQARHLWLKNRSLLNLTPLTPYLIQTGGNLPNVCDLKSVCCLNSPLVCCHWFWLRHQYPQATHRLRSQKSQLCLKCQRWDICTSWDPCECWRWWCTWSR